MKTTQWEYRIDTLLQKEIKPILENRGAHGWELCGVISSPPPSDMSSNWPGVVQFIFKRPTP